MRLPDAFQRSYTNCLEYPLNVACKTTYSGALRSYRARLEEESERLFETVKDQQAQVPFRDLYAHQETRKRNIYDDGELKQWLGDESTIFTVIPSSSSNIATRKDPNCRFIFFWAEHSWDKLNVTQQMAERVLSYHQVMPEYLEFIFPFGSQSDHRDLRFCGFREQTLLQSPTGGLEIAELGRSGRQFQLCYNLKTVACVKTPPLSPDKIANKEWRVRQAAFHHQFDVVTGTTLWIVTRGGLDIKEGIQELTGKEGRPEDKCFNDPDVSLKSSFAIHLYYCYWATENWRWYIQWLELMVERGTDMAVQGRRGREFTMRTEYTTDNLQEIQSFKDEISQAAMILEGNVDIITALHEYYDGLLHNVDFPLKKCEGAITVFTSKLKALIRDLKMQVRRINLLNQIASDRKALIMEHLQTQATEKMETLSCDMRLMTGLSQREAIAMRIITVVTLIYLPATFVSTFFSTDVIKYQNENMSASFSFEALMRWLQLTIPLTFVTLVIAGLYFRHKDKKLPKEGIADIWLNRNNTGIQMQKFSLQRGPTFKNRPSS